MDMSRFVIMCILPFSVAAMAADDPSDKEQNGRGLQPQQKQNRPPMEMQRSGPAPTPFDASRQKQNNSNVNTGGQQTQRTDGVHGINPDQKAQKADGTDSAKKKAMGLDNSTAINTGANNQGTFGDERMNRGRYNDVRDFAGSGSGKANDDSPDVTNAKNQGAADLLRREGGTPTGNWQRDIKEVEYAQKAGTDGYAATKNMTDAQRTNYWNDANIKQRLGTSRPTEDQDTGGRSGTPVMKGQSPDAQKKAVITQGKAGGGNDPRTDNSGTGGVMIRREQTADGAQKEAGGGTVNFDKALEINKTVNPTRQ